MTAMLVRTRREEWSSVRYGARVSNPIAGIGLNGSFESGCNTECVMRIVRHLKNLLTNENREAGISIICE